MGNGLEQTSWEDAVPLYQAHLTNDELIRWETLRRGSQEDFDRALYEFETWVITTGLRRKVSGWDDFVSVAYNKFKGDK